MKVFYKERFAINFGFRRRCDGGNNVVLSTRAGGAVIKPVKKSVMLQSAVQTPDKTVRGL